MEDWDGIDRILINARNIWTPRLFVKNRSHWHPASLPSSS